MSDAIIRCAAPAAQRAIPRAVMVRSPHTSHMDHRSTVLPISAQVSIPLEEIELTAMRAQSAGGQNVNKVSSAIHLTRSGRQIHSADANSMMDTAT